MANLKLLFTVSTIFIFSALFSQNPYGINHNINRSEVCGSMLPIFLNKPKEVQFSVKRDGDKLFFHVNNQSWFNALFNDPKHALALDIVEKSIYECGLKNQNKQFKGLLTKPILGKELKRNLIKIGDNAFKVFISELPNALKDKDIEYNILFLYDNNLCRYQTIYNLEAYPWGLLDMGMYLDSLTYSNKTIKPDTKEAYLFKNKSLTFIIPFEKNKSNYTSEDIKPIYDSLRLTDFNIKNIDIKAYSSVEGSLERNIQLQEERANSIVKALQSFQKPTITTKVSSSENWVEFFNDIQSTKYQNLAELSKNQIKSKLVGNLSTELEPILKDHRKAVLKLELQKKDKYEMMSADELIENFNSALGKNELDKARQIHNSILEKIKTDIISPDLLRKMQLPRQSKYIDFLNKNAVIKVIKDAGQSLIVYDDLKELKKLVLKDKKVNYNLMALKIKLWRYNALDIKSSQLKSDIQNLKSFGIPNSLISRMMVNYHIVRAEKLMRKRDYKNKDTSVEYINSNYQNFPLSDFDYLSLAQFFSYYANTGLAINLLDKKVKSIDVDEDLLYYFINLTIIDDKLTSNDDYRTVLLNAINMNKDRFCKLFNAVEDGGVTFQLLENEYLLQIYCENCVDDYFMNED
jgi:hypothetical protein